MAHRFTTGATGTGDTVTITKATLTGLGFVDGDTLTLVMRQPGSQTITWPSGYSTNGTATNSGAGSGRAESTAVAVKYVASVASEPSSYTVSIGGSNGDTITLEIMCHSGRNNSAATVTATNNAASSASPVSIPLAGGTAATGDDAIWVGCISYTGASTPWVTTPPGSYTLRQDQSLSGAFYGGNVGICTRDALASGAIGTLTGSAALTSASADSYGLVVLLPVLSAGGSIKSLLTLGVG
jgi:hypothetical protein